ncbi:hypothetical protein pb186bvf_005782 [Paramecium bursaria]
MNQQDIFHQQIGKRTVQLSNYNILIPMLVDFDESCDCRILPNFSSEESTTKLEKRIKYCLKTKITKKKKESKQHHQFTSDDDKRILRGVLKHGPKFDKLVRYFPCSINVVKNRYYKYLRYRWDIVLGCEYKSFNFPHPTLVEQQILEIERLQSQIGLDEQMQSILKPFLNQLACFDQGSEMQ